MIDLTLKDDIIFATFPKGLKVDLNGVKQIVEERKKLQNGGTNPLLVYFSSVFSNTMDMRKFMAVEGASGISCVAFVVKKNNPAEVLIKLFLLAQKPNIPSKVFHEEEEAVKWLKANHK